MTAVPAALLAGALVAWIVSVARTMVLFFARVTRGAAAVILYALGVMSLLWMAVVASLNFAQKVLPRGDRLTLPSALAFVALGIWIAAPTAPPGWSDPTRRPRRPR